MTDKIVNLNVERVEAEGDCRLMTVEDILEETLKYAKDYGWNKCVLVLHRPNGEGRFTVDRRFAGCSRLEVQGLMFSAIKEEMND